MARRELSDVFLKKQRRSKKFFVTSSNALENHKITAFAIRDSIADAISKTIPDLNQRQYKRYKKYAIWDPDNYKMNIYNDVLIYSTVKGSKVKGGGQNNSRGSFALKYPKVTVFESSTEAPDETARGEWLKMVENWLIMADDG